MRADKKLFFLDETAAHGFQRRFGARIDVELAVYRLEVGGDGVGGDIELLRHIGAFFAAGDECQDFVFAFGQGDIVVKAGLFVEITEHVIGHLRCDGRQAFENIIEVFEYLVRFPVL